jgi:hypothetical protein
LTTWSPAPKLTQWFSKHFSVKTPLSVDARTSSVSAPYILPCQSLYSVENAACGGFGEGVLLSHLFLLRSGLMHIVLRSVGCVICRYVVQWLEYCSGYDYQIIDAKNYESVDVRWGRTLDFLNSMENKPAEPSTKV